MGTSGVAGEVNRMRLSSMTAAWAGVVLAAVLILVCAPDAEARGAVSKPKKEVDFYEVLGVSRDATDKDIKKAFRKLSIKEHPDKGGDKEKFQQIQRAYEVLSDEELRLVYDHAG